MCQNSCVLTAINVDGNCLNITPPAEIDGKIPFISTEISKLATKSAKNSTFYQQLQKDISAYNAIIRTIVSMQGFWKYFSDNKYIVSKNDVLENFGSSFADKIFSLKDYVFKQELFVKKGYLYSNQCMQSYRITFDGKDVIFNLTPDGITYPKYTAISRKLIWNFARNDSEIMFSLYQKFKSCGMINDIQSYECFEKMPFDFQMEDYMDPRICKCFDILERYGFCRTYTVVYNDDYPIWNLLKEAACPIKLVVFLGPIYGNALFKEKLELVLSLNRYEASKKLSFLTNSDGHQVISDNKGMLGGHYILKIYGQLDCRSANRYIAEGKYIQNRLFFANEETAINAGFRPCAVCMPEAYKKWKDSNQNK